MGTETIDTLGAFFGWADVGLGRKRIACPRCRTPIELRVMDDLLEAACPSCGRGPFFERARELEAARGPDEIGRLLEKLGILGEQEVAAARDAADPRVPASVDDESSGLVGAARALGLFAKSLYLATASQGSADAALELVARPLRELIGPDQLREALEVERREGTSVGEVVAGLALRAQKDLILQEAGAAAHIDLDGWAPQPPAVALVPAGVAASYLAIPVRIDREALVIAVRDPLDFELIDNLKVLTGRDVRALAAAEDALFRALERLYPEKELREGQVPAGPTEAELAEIESSSSELDKMEDMEALADAVEAGGEASLSLPDEPPGERTLNLLLLQAVEDRVEQIILEPLEDGYRVRFRRAGRLREVARLPQAAGDAAIERAMLLASLDLSKRARPQQGTLPLTIAGESLEIAAALVPAVLGSVLSLTLREASFRLLALDGLALVPGDSGLLRGILAPAPGLTLVSSPPGEGKTTLLYALLRDVDRTREHVVMLERTMRARVEGAVQLCGPEYGPLAGVAGDLRPDRVFMDDLLAGAAPHAARDEARLAIDLALSGAQVVVAVTAPDAVAAIARLVAAGSETGLLLASLRSLVGLRLVRRICPRCREEFEADPEVATAIGLGDSAGARRLSIGIGCWECGGTGYRGRSALTEVIAVDEPMREPLRSLEIARVRARAAERGVRALPDKALLALRSGLTSVSQVERVVRGR